MPEDFSESNPFTPSFGEVPARLAGRDDVLRSVKRAFQSDIRRPELTMVITGARGTGKTAMLSKVAEEAQLAGWIAVNAMSIKGMLDDILYQSRRAASHLVDTQTGPKVAGVGIGDFVHLDLRDYTEDENWRSRMNDLLDALGEQEVGLLITVDEVQPHLEEMVQLAAVYQLFVREGRKVALILAGLPHNISSLLQDKSVSFLRRAHLCRLGRLADVDVRLALKQSIEEVGRRIGDDELSTAVAASDGFPFMMQLVGYHMWDTNPISKTITKQDVKSGVDTARQIMRERVLDATYRGLSKGDKAFLSAMAIDDKVSEIGTVASRMGKTVAYATQYKRRLMEQGIIGERGRARIGFDLPLMREYVREQEVK